MAEVVGLAASIIAITQLLAKATSLSYGYVGGVKRAPDDIQNFMKGLGSLTRVLTTLEGCVKSNPGSEALKEMEDPLKECINEMDKLVAKLQPKGWWKKKMARFKWPLKETETEEYIARLERHKSFFIIALNTHQISRSKVVESNVEEIKADIKDLKTSAAQDISRQNQAKRRGILNWLSPDAFDTKHQEISHRRQKNTGGWLLRRPEFLDWAKKNPNSALLWGYGIPGAGKTFLCSRVIDHLLSQAQAASYGVAYIYFDYKERDQQKPIRILASLIKQLVCQIQLLDLPTELEDLHTICDHGQRKPTFLELYTVLLGIIKSGSFAQTFIICDALDECDQGTRRKDLLPFFHQMGNNGINVFLTSRDYLEDIQDSLQSVAKVKLWAQEEDITNYIEQKINESPRARRLVGLGNCKDIIITELTACARGMFLLVHFHIEYLCQQTTVREIFTELERLKSSTSGVGEGPLSSLSPTYDRAMETLRGQAKSCVVLAFKILSWLVKSRRTLTVRELQLAVSVAQDRLQFDELDLPDRKTLLEVCASLVIIDEISDTVMLAHYTVQEYLVQTSIILDDAEFQLTVACITFLSLDTFTQGACTSQSSFDARCSLYPFLDYAAQYFPSHLNACDETLPTKLVIRFLRRPGCITSYLQARPCKRPFYINPREYTMYPLQPPLHVAAFIGHYPAVQLLLEETDVMTLDSWGNTALFMAVMNGHSSVAQLLLDNGAEFSDKDTNNNTNMILGELAIKGHVSVIKLLLERGIDVQSARSDGVTALHCAAEGGHESVARLLLEKGAEISAIDRRGRMAIHTAAQNQHEEVVRVLLENGADPSYQDQQGTSALHFAAIGGAASMAQLLVENGANIALEDDSGKTALHFAAMQNQESVVRVLIESGADFSASGGDSEEGGTALHWAVIRETSSGQECPSLVRYLLDKGADITATDKNGAPVLHWAALSGSETIVNMLFEVGAEASLHILDNEGSGVLHYALRETTKTSTVVEILVEKGADPFVVNNDGESVLALSKWHPAHHLILKAMSTIQESR